ncbi:MAG: hypothetical protein LPK15_04365, partial [Alteromonadaceae bacterium]|nr:hypothetical protein [Alteromonadaceae bacterium]
GVLFLLWGGGGGGWGLFFFFFFKKQTAAAPNIIPKKKTTPPPATGISLSWFRWLSFEVLGCICRIFSCVENGANIDECFVNFVINNKREAFCGARVVAKMPLMESTKEFE